MNRHWILLLLSLGTLGAVSAEDLQTVYDHALIADPTMQQAAALHMASRETRTQAILDMLPLNGTATKNWSGVAGSSTGTPEKVSEPFRSLNQKIKAPTIISMRP